jgi:hypothetical protein
MAKVTLSEKLAQFSDTFAPRTVATFNGHDIMVVKLSGPFVWHKHDDTDDFFSCSRERSTSSCATRPSRSARASCSSCRKASSTAPSPATRFTCC